jgi:nucleolin
MARSSSKKESTKSSKAAVSQKDVALVEQKKALLQEKLDAAQVLAAEIQALQKEVRTLLETTNADAAVSISVSSKEDGDDSSSDDSSSDDEEEGAPVKKEPSTKKKKAEDSSSEDSSSDDDSSDEEEEDNQKVQVSKTVTKKQEKEDDDDSSDDDSDDDSADPMETTKAVAKAKEEADDDSSDDDSDEPTTKAVTPTKVDAKKKDEAEDDSDDDSSDDEEEEEKVVDKKRKAPEPVEDASSAKKRAVDTSHDSNEITSVYVRGLPWRATEDEIHDFFSTCGTIQTVEQPLMEDGRSSGTAIVTFADATAATAAVALNGGDFQGRWLSIQFNTPKTPKAMPQGGREPSAKDPGCITVFIGNLAWDVDEDAIRQAFGSCGEITSVRFATDKETGDFKGFGHVEFTETEATDAAVALAGTEICGRPVRVDYANDRRAAPSPGGGRGGGGRGGRGYMGGGGGGRGGGGRGGRGGGRDSGRGAPPGRAKSSGAITAFSGNRITFD